MKKEVVSDICNGQPWLPIKIEIKIETEENQGTFSPAEKRKLEPFEHIPEEASISVVNCVCNVYEIKLTN